MADEKNLDDAKDLKDEDVLLKKEEPAPEAPVSEDNEENLEDALKTLFGEEEPEVEEEKSTPEEPTKPETPKSSESERPSTPAIDESKIAKIVEERVEQIVNAKTQQQQISQHIAELRNSENGKEKEKVVVNFLKNRPDFSEGIIREAQKRGINPLTKIYEYAKRENESETPPEISGKGAYVKRSKLPPEEQIVEEIMSVKKGTGNDEETKAKNILT